MFRILVVDDDVVQLDLYKQLLEIAGYRVEVAADGPAGIAGTGPGSGPVGQGVDGHQHPGEPG